MRIDIPDGHDWLAHLARMRDKPLLGHATCSVEFGGIVVHYEMIEVEMIDARHDPARYRTVWRMLTDDDG